MKYTGDPFVDAGGAALEYLQNKFPQKNLIELIEYSAKIFIYNWNNKIDSLQLNSLITHNSRKGSKAKQDKALESTLIFFKDLFGDGKNSVAHGYCRICGIKDKLYKAGREIYPLSGSAAFVNFHHAHEEGFFLCKDCITKLFFLPFMILQMGGNLALLHISNEKIKNYWTEKTIDKNINKIARNISGGILSADLKNPKNALFDIAKELIINFDAYNEVLQLFYFTNFGSKPFCEIYTMPNSVFVYISKVLRNCREEWFLFVGRYYKISKSEWDYDNNEWIVNNTHLSENKYKNNQNIVFEYLLSGRSLIPIFRKFYKERLKRNYGIDVLLLDYYLMEVKKMNTEQLTVIKRLGESIIEIAKKEGNIKKYLTVLEKSSRAYQLRAAIISLIKKNYLQGNEEPLLTLNEYVEYLFPDGQNWSEIRDILIIYLYELLHKENVRIEIEDTLPEEPLEELNEI